MGPLTPVKIKLHPTGAAQLARTNKDKRRQFQRGGGNGLTFIAINSAE